WPLAARVASSPVRICGLYDHLVIDRVAGGESRRLMSVAEQRQEEPENLKPAAAPPAAPRPLSLHRTWPHVRVVPLLITLVTVALAGVRTWAMWNAYMGTPWTRDGRVRVYVVTIAPQVAGNITELPVVDDQFVRKGDLLMVIDPTNYKIAVELAQAAVEQA